MKRFALGLALAAMLAVPGSALGFHHGGLPSTVCADESAVSPSNNNGNAKEALTAAGLFPPALPPVGTPGVAKGQGGENCAGHEHVD